MNDKHTHLLEWLQGKIADAEKAVKAREQLEETWRIGDDKSWAEAAALHPDTKDEPPMKKADRLKESAAQGRIAARCRHDLEMLNEIATRHKLQNAVPEMLKALEEIAELTQRQQLPLTWQIHGIATKAASLPKP